MRSKNGIAFYYFRCARLCSVRTEPTKEYITRLFGSGQSYGRVPINRYVFNFRAAYAVIRYGTLIYFKLCVKARIFVYVIAVIRRCKGFVFIPTHKVEAFLFGLGRKREERTCLRDVVAVHAFIAFHARTVPDGVRRFNPRVTMLYCGHGFSVLAVAYPTLI